MHFENFLFDQKNNFETSHWNNISFQNENRNDFFIYKKIENIPPHEYLKIEANFHFLSPFWNGNAAYLKINNKLVWLDHHDWNGN